MTLKFLIVLFLAGAMGAAFGDEARWNQLMYDADGAIEQGDYRTAISHYNTIIDEDPDNVDALEALARLYATAQDPRFYDGRLAVEFALMALDIAPNDVIILETLAEGYFAQSQFERAIFELSKCKAFFPDDTRYDKKLKRYALTWKGRLEINKGANDELAKCKACYYTGLAELRLGAIDGALEWLQKASEFQASLPELSLTLAQANFEAGFLERALEILNARGAEAKVDPVALRLMGRVLAAAGDREKAVSSLEKARQLRGDSKELLLDLGRVYLESDENVKSLMVLKEALDLPQGRDARDRGVEARITRLAGMALERLGESALALEMFYATIAALGSDADLERDMQKLFAADRGAAGTLRGHLAVRVAGWSDPVVFTAATGKAAVGGRGGAAFGDIDQDGDPDLLVGGKTLYRNEGRKGFKDITAETGFSGIQEPAGGLFADWDNDGDLDIFIFSAMSGIRGRFFENRGKRGFSDLTAKDVSPVAALPTAAASFGDLNGDGFIDLYLGHRFPSGGDGTGVVKGCQDTILINKGGGAFESVDTDAGIGLDWPLNAESVLIVDYDGDGDRDIVVANTELHPNSLWRNESSGTLEAGAIPRFVEVGAAAGVRGKGFHRRYGSTQAVLAGDCDGNGAIDLFLSNIAPFGERAFANTSQFGFNGGRPEYVFDDRFSSSGLFTEEYHSGGALGDLDNDGDLDLFLSCGEAPGGGLRLFINDGQGRFQDVTWLAGLGAVRAEGCALADVDSDGDLDLFASGETGQLFENSGNENHWIGFRLIGKNCNVTAINARVTVDVDGRSMVREVLGGRGRSQDDMVVHFGLGSHRKHVNASIQWPHGRSEFLTRLAVDRYHTITDK